MGGGGFLFFSYFIQHCFICRPSDSTVPTGSNPGSLQLVHWQSDALTTRLDLIRTRLNLIRLLYLISSVTTVTTPRVQDTGVSVRKRVIKILKDICLEFPDYPRIPEICVKIIRRINDEEGIRKLVMEAGLEKNPGLKKTAQWGFLVFFWGFLVFFWFFGFFLPRGEGF